jgi:hypothetical protein
MLAPFATHPERRACLADRAVRAPILGAARVGAARGARGHASASGSGRLSLAAASEG